MKLQQIAPVYVGEFGGRSVGQDVEGKWQRSRLGFLKQTGISHSYWSWNPDSGDTGGLLEDDWKTVDRAKLDVISAYQWPAAPEPAPSPRVGFKRAVTNDPRRAVAS